VRGIVSFLKLLFSFAPWIVFLVIARDTLLRVEIGLAAALVASVVMASEGVPGPQARVRSGRAQLVQRGDIDRG